ncbi:hypothetical protein PG989_000180 [Apiospora arundinis]
MTPFNYFAYPTLTVIDVRNLAQSHLLRPVQSLRSKRRSTTFDSARVPDGPTDGHVPIPSELVQANPPFPHEYCDARLRNLDISFWTNANISDEFGRRCISLYLTTDHPLFGFFDPHLFIGDLVEQQEGFCSRFLVNALLHLGCNVQQMYCNYDPSADRLVQFFLEEAEHLWEIEKEHDTLLTMAGAAMLSRAHMDQCQYHNGHLYAQEVTRIGVSLGLFGPDSLATTASNENSTSADHLARCYAAWGGFNWNVHVSLFYRQPGTKRPICPPKLSIPRGSKFMLHNADVPSVMDTTFHTLCQFWQIIQRADWIRHTDLDDAADHIKRKLTEYYSHEIVAWVETLPLTSLRREGCPHHVIVSHIWIHAAIIDILRSVPKFSSNQNEPTRAVSASESFPEFARNASVNQLKSLLVEYRMNYEEAAYSALWHTGLLYLADATLHEMENADWRVYFMFCVYGYETLRRPYPVSDVIIQGLQSMSNRYADSPGTGARLLLHRLTEQGLEHVKDHISNEIRAMFLAGRTLVLEGKS